MGEAERDGAADEEKLERATKNLREIWVSWGLEPGETGSAAQVNALPKVIAWLEDGTQSPERVVRAVQQLLCDPEKPGVHKRPCWTALTDTLATKWPSVGTRSLDVHFMQALLLAAWPVASPEFPAVELLGPAWSLVRGRESQRKRLTEWLDAQTAPAPRGEEGARMELEYHKSSVPAVDTGLAAITNYLSALDSAMTAGHGPQNWRPQLMAILNTLRDTTLSLKKIGDENKVVLEQNTALIRDAIVATAQERAVAARNDLLWWGQARYSHALRKPYRRFDNAEDVTFWAPLEAAKLAHAAGADIEPSACYVVEVLRALDRDVNETRPLRDWMRSLLDTLRATGDKTAPPSTTLTTLASEDALGMPVTWVRLRAAEKKDLEGAAEAIALPLDETLDRGQWAAWIFRESLLDLRLGQEGES